MTHGRIHDEKVEAECERRQQRSKKNEKKK
jgi:hypothetical protein